jgi:hypothetical protein
MFSSCSSGRTTAVRQRDSRNLRRLADKEEAPSCVLYEEIPALSFIAMPKRHCKSTTPRCAGKGQAPWPPACGRGRAQDCHATQYRRILGNDLPRDGTQAREQHNGQSEVDIEWHTPHVLETGYKHETCEPLGRARWKQVDHKLRTHASDSRAYRIESIWLSPAAQKNVRNRELSLPPHRTTATGGLPQSSWADVFLSQL